MPTLLGVETAGKASPQETGEDLRKRLDRYKRRLDGLEKEQASWQPHWKELADYILPRRYRLAKTDRNRGTKRNDRIINGRATRSSRVLASGMMAGLTSPSRPWFRLTTSDPGLADYLPVRNWLHDVEELMREVFHRSNIYNALAHVYEDLAVFGVHATCVEADYEDVIRGYTFPLGTYFLATSYRGQVDTVYRRLGMTSAQLVERFARKACSAQVTRAYDEKRWDQWFDVVYAIEPNPDAEPGRAGWRNMPYRSCWFEEAVPSPVKVLRDGGFEEFPVLAPRWSVVGEDVYGVSPAMDALGDIKGLQALEKRKAQVLDQIAEPAVSVPAEMRRNRVSMIPGDKTFLPKTASNAEIKPLFTPDPRALALDGEIQRYESRIAESFFADLWLMLAEGSRRQITAEEVRARQEEKMLQLGPVLERLQDELLDPLIDRAFRILARRGFLPPAPEELQGLPLRVEYVSILAQAQRLVGVSGIEHLTRYVVELASAKPRALYKLNEYELVDEMQRALGTSPKLLRSDEEADEVAQAAADAERMARAAEMAGGLKDAALAGKAMSETDPTGDSVLSRLTGAA